MKPDEFRHEFVRRHGFHPPKAMVDFIFLPAEMQAEAFAAIEYRPLPPEAVLADENRWPAMPPGFFPFADVGDGDLAGLYYPWRRFDGRIPVAHFLHETGHLCVLASDIRGFILRQLLSQPLRFWPDAYLDTPKEREQALARARRWAARFDIPECTPGRLQPWSAGLYASSVWGRHTTVLEVDPAAPGSHLWYAQHDLAEGRIADALKRLEGLLREFPDLGGAYTLKARCLLLQGRVEEAVAAYLASLRCPIATCGHRPGRGGLAEFDVGLPEGPDGEVANFAHSCPAPPAGFLEEPLVDLALDLKREVEAWMKAMGTPAEKEHRLDNARHARRRRELAEQFWREGRQREAIAQMLNVLFLTWHEADQGKAALATLAEWYGEAQLIGNEVVIRHARRLVGMERAG